MKKSLLTLSLAVSAFVAPVVTSAEVASDLAGKTMMVGEAVTEITPGNWYLLNNVNRGNYVKEETSAYKMRVLPTSTSASENAGYLFKITNSTTEGKYNIQSGNGLYFALGNNNSSVSQTARDFDIQKIGSAANIFYMQDVESQYIADGQPTGSNFVGWGTAIPTNTNGNSAYRFISVSIADKFVDVTYTFTTLTGQTFTRTVSVADGADAAAHIPTIDYFTATGLQETETTVGENAKAFNVTGTWSYPIKANTVYRIRIRPDDGPNYVAANADGSAIQTSSSATGTELEKTIMWYFKSVGYDAEGHPTFTMHSLSDMTKGVTFQNNNSGNASSLGETPTQLMAVPSTGENFAFKFTIDGTEHFVNRRETNFSSWTVAGGAYASETGCRIRATSLTDDDFATLAMSATEDEINAAKANPTPEAISALIDKYQASPLALAIAAAEEYNGFIGTGIGQYNNAAGDFADKLAEAKALLNNPDATEDEINAAIEAIAVSNLSINQPKAGHFYRFHYGNKYLSNTTVSVTANGVTSDRFALETQSNADALNNTTVFYYDGSHLVTYPGGLLMGKMEIKTNLKSFLKDDANVATITFVGSRFEKGKYNIHSAENDRYLYHRSDNDWTDSGDTNGVASNDTGYRWEITEVEYLPVPYSGNAGGYFTVCAPVELDITQWSHATPYIGVLQGENVGKKALDNGVLPANTPAILLSNDGAQHGCVYFRISGYPEISAAAEATNDLTNTGVYAAAKEEGQSYFTVNGGDSFASYDGDTLPAFAAVLKVPTEQAKAEGYAITDFDPDYVSITEIEGAANNGKQVIYDLQGRRVQRASKGLYIINGVKTLVK